MSAPATALATEVQHERRVSAIQLSTASGRADGLPEARGQTDRAIDDFLRRATALETTSVLSPKLGDALAEVTAQVQKLRTIRGDIDGGIVNRLQAVQAFSTITDAIYRLQDQVVTVSEIDLYQQAVGLQRISHAHDLLSREDALISGAILAGELTHDEYEAMEVLAPNRRLLLSEGVAALDDELSAPFNALLVSPTYRGLVALELEIADASTLPRDRNAWQPLAGAFSATVDRFLVSRASLLNDRADAAAGGIIAQIIIAGGLGLAAILGAVILSAKLGRRLAEELGHLRMTALELAEVRLPQVVERLRRGRRWT
ncbi:nitrate- and nitrite sensing domain-containing protein [Streptosporangium lutulentum]